MSQTRQMLQALKKCQRARGITYRELGERLGVSEPTIKRWFSTGAFTLKNLEEICNVLEVNILELAKLTDMYGPELITRLSWAQEQALADDPTLLRFSTC